AEAADRRAAASARAVRARCRRGDLPAGRRRLLRQAEERVPLTLNRVSVMVATAQAERARAIMIELFPEGFEELDRDGGVELAAYTDPSGEERLWAAFGGVRSDAVEEGWQDRWRAVPPPVPLGPIWGGPARGVARPRAPAG